MKVASEILLVEGASGDFVPAPTRAQTRRAKRDADARKKRRKDRWEMVAGILLLPTLFAFFFWIGTWN
jgi:hypothetical protein